MLGKSQKTASLVMALAFALGASAGVFGQTMEVFPDKPDAKALPDVRVMGPAPAKPKWLAEPVGMEALSPDYVPPGWNELKVEGNSVVSGGKVYEFGPGGILTRAEMDGRALTKGPMRVECVVRGTRLKWIGEPTVIKQIGRGLVEVKGASESTEFRLEVTSWIEYDFLLRQKIVLIPKTRGGVSVSGLWIKYDLPAELMDVAQYHGESPAKPLNGPETNALMVNRFVPAKDALDMPYCPIVWVGDLKNGMGFYVEEVRDWNVAKGKPYMQMGKALGGMQMNLIGVATPVTKAMTYEVMVQPTPVRPLPGDWRAWNVTSRGGFTKSPPANGTNMLIYWDNLWNLTNWSFYDGVRNPERLKEQIQIDKKAGMPILAYMEAQMLSFGQFLEYEGKKYYFEDPVSRYYAHRWRATTAYQTLSAPDPDAALVSGFEQWMTTFGDKRLQAAKTNSLGVTLNSEHTDLMASWLADFVKLGVDGLYLDSIRIRTDHSTNGPDGNMAYTTPDGQAHGTTRFREARAMAKRFRYVLQDGTDRRTRMLAHVSGTFPMAYMGLFDLGLTGENTYYWYRDPAKRDLSQDGDFYYAHIWGNIDDVSVELYGPGRGAVALFLPELRDKKGTVFPKLTKGTRTMMSYLLHMDVLMWPIYCDSSVVYGWWKVKDRFGMADSGNEKVTFTQYRQNKLVTCADKNVYVSVYRKGDLAAAETVGKFLVIASNHRFEPSGVTLKMPMAWAGQSVRNGETGQEMMVSESGELKVELGPYEYVILEAHSTGVALAPIPAPQPAAEPVPQPQPAVKEKGRWDDVLIPDGM